MSRLFVKTLLFLGVTVSAYSQNVVGLNDAVETAIRQNPDLVQFREKLSQKTWDKRQALGNFLPTVSLSGGYTVLNDPLVMDLDPIRDAMIGSETKIYEKIWLDSLTSSGATIPAPMLEIMDSMYRAGVSKKLSDSIPHFIDTVKQKCYPEAAVTITQPLFVGGRVLAGTRAASAEKAAAQAELAHKTDEVISNTAAAWSAVSLLNSVVTVRKEVFGAMQKHEAHAHAALDAGMRPKTDWLRAQVALAEARRNLEDDSNRLLLARLALGRCLGLPDGDTPNVTDSLVVAKREGSLDDFLTSAQKSQPLLEVISNKKAAARAKLFAERGEALPVIAAFGKCELFQSYLSPLEPKWALGLNATWNIFSCGKILSKTMSASHLVKESEAAENAAQHDIALLVRKSWIECDNAESRAAELESDDTLAQENLRQSRSRFENGYGTSLDVIDAELSVQKTKIDRLTTRYNYTKAFMDLYSAAGESRVACKIIADQHGGLR